MPRSAQADRQGGETRVCGLTRRIPEAAAPWLWRVGLVLSLKRILAPSHDNRRFPRAKDHWRLHGIASPTQHALAT